MKGAEQVEKTIKGHWQISLSIYIYYTKAPGLNKGREDPEGR